MAVGKGQKFLSFVAGLDIQGSKNLITQEMKEILPERVEALQLQSKLDPAMFKDLQKYMSGQVISAKRLTDLKEALIAIQKDEISLNRRNKTEMQASEYVNLQLAKAIGQVAAETKAANIAVKNYKVDQATDKLTEFTVEVKDAAGAIKTLHAVMKDGQAVLNKTASAKVTVDKDLADSVKTIRSQYDEIEKIQKEAIRKGVEGPELDAEIEARRKIIEMERERHASILEANKAIYISEQERVKQANQLNDIIKEREEQLVANAATDRTFKQGSDAKRAGEQLLQNEREIAKLEKLILIDKNANLSVTNEKIAGYKKENEELRKILSLSESISEEYESQVALEKANASQKVETKFADQSLLKMGKESKDALKAYKALEIARRTGNIREQKEQELALSTARRRMEVEKESTMSRLQDASVLEDYQRRALKLMDEEIEKQMELNAQIELEAEQINKDFSAKFGSNTFGEVQLPKIEEKDIERISSSKEEFQKLVQESLGADVAFRDFNQTIDKTGRFTNIYTVEIGKTGNEIKKVQVALDTYTGEVVANERAIRDNSAIHSTFAARLTQTFKKLTAYVGVSTLIYGALAKIREGFQFVIELDKELTNVAITTGMNKEQTDALGESYSALAETMGKTTMEIAAANTELVRQGLSIEESGRRLEQVIKLSAVGAISTAEALKVITTGVNAMKVSAQELSDVLVNAGQLSASSVEELGEAFQKVASSAYASNLSLTETTSILATMTEVTQEDASSVGTALKTFIARFNNITDAADESGESLNKVQDAIESVGVAFTSSNGQIRDLFSILSDLNKVWGGLDQNTKSYIATQAAGTRQQNKFFAVMDNFNRTLQLNNELVQSAGKLQEGYNVYLDSLEAKANSARASLEQLWQNDLFPQLVEFASTSVKGITDLIDKIGLLGVAVSGIGVAYAASDFKSLWAESTKTVLDTSKAAETLSGKTLEKLTRGLKQVKNNSLKVADAAAVMTGGFMKFAKIGGVTLGKLLIQFSAIVGPSLIFMGIIEGITYLLEKQKKESEKINQQVQDYTSNILNLSTTTSNLSDSVKRYNELRSKVGTGNAKDRLGNAEYEEFLSLNKEIEDLVPKTSSYIDGYGDKVYSLSGDYDSLNKALRENLDLEKERILRSEEYQSRIKEQKKEAIKFHNLELALQNSLKPQEETAKKKLDNANENGYKQSLKDNYKKELEDIQNEIEKTENQMSDFLNGSEITAMTTEFAALYDFETQEEQILVQTKDFKKKYLDALVSGEDLADFAISMKDYAASFDFSEEEKKFERLKKKLDLEGATEENTNALKQYRISLEKLQAQEVGTLGFDILGNMIQNASSLLVEMSTKTQDFFKSGMDEVQAFEKTTSELEGAFEKVKDGTGLSVEEIGKLRESSEDAYQWFLKTGDATFENGKMLKQIAKDENDSLKKRILALIEIAKTEAGITEEKSKQARLTRAELMSELMIAKKDGDTETVEAIQSTINHISEALKSIPFLQALITDIDKFSTDKWGIDDKDTNKLEKYFFLLKELAMLQKDQAELEFRDGLENQNLNEKRIKNLREQMRVNQEIANARVKNLSTLLAKEKALGAAGKVNADLQNEIREEQEAIKDITLTRLQLEEQIIDVIQSNYKTYEDQLSRIEVVKSRISLLEAQDADTTAERATLLKLVASEEKKIADGKRAELAERIKASQDINLTETVRATILRDIATLQAEINEYEASSLNTLKQIQDLEKEKEQKLSDEKAAIREIYALVEEMLRSQMEEELRILEDQLSTAKEILDAKLQELDTAKALDDLEEKRTKRSKELADITAKIASLQVAAATGDIKAKNEILKLQEQEKSKIEEIQEAQEDEYYEEQKKALQDTYDTLEKEINESKKSIEDLLNDTTRMQQLVSQKITNSLNDMMALQKELIEVNRDHGTGIDADITDRWKGAYEAASSYFDLLRNNKGSFDLNTALNRELQPGATSTNSSSLSGSEMTTIKDIMENNSKQWRETRDDKSLTDSEKSAIMNELRMFNQVLGKIAGFFYDSPTGTWYADASKSTKLYDNGGLKPKGQTGMMAEDVKEWVFHDDQLKAVQKQAIGEFLKDRSSLEVQPAGNLIQINIEGDITDNNLNRITSEIKDIIREVSQGQVDVMRQRGIKNSFKNR